MLASDASGREVPADHTTEDGNNAEPVPERARRRGRRPTDQAVVTARAGIILELDPTISIRALARFLGVRRESARLAKARVEDAREWVRNRQRASPGGPGISQ